MITLKTLELVEITQPFIHMVHKYFAEKLERLQRNQRFHDSDGTQEAKTLRYYQTDNGWQMFLTRLKQLPYQRFEAIQSRGQIYMKAVTKALIVHMPEARRRDFRQYLPEGNYNLGEYAIYIPYRDMLSSHIEDFHFIPEKYKRLRPGESYHPRHLHHYARLYSDEGALGNPLSYTARTCWGNFGSIISLTLNVGDIPELFRALHLFATIQNPDSPLVAPTDLTHIYERINHAN